MISKVQDIKEKLIQSGKEQIGKRGRFQERTLRRLLNNAKETMFGKHYDFASLLEEKKLMKAYQDRVPIHTYDEIYNKWWSKMLEGNPNVAWKGMTQYFALSSGTSNATSKYIPVTKEMKRSMAVGGLRIVGSIHKFDIPYGIFLKDWLTIGGSASLERLHCSMVGDLSGINSCDPPAWISKFKKPGIEIAKLKTWQERTNAIVKNAPDWDVSTLVGIPSWVQLTLENIIERHKLNTIHDIWPNLSLFVTGGINFDPYKKSFEELLGGKIQYMDTYLASEGFLAYQNSPESSSMSLMMNNGIFFEFIPFTSDNFDEDGNHKKNAQSITVHEIKEGVEYAMMITTCSGTWRYLIGDTVIFEDALRKKIKITGRTSQFLSVCGEHVSVDNLDSAVGKLAEKHGIMIKEFTVGAVPVNGHYKHQWFVGKGTSCDSEQLAKWIDEELKLINDDYRAERGAMLQSPSVQFVDSKVFLKWIESRGKMNGQSKVPRVMKKDKLDNWISFIDAHNQYIFK